MTRSCGGRRGGRVGRRRTAAWLPSWVRCSRASLPGPQLRGAIEAVRDEARDEAGRVMPPLIRLKSHLERKGLITNYQSGKVLKGDTDGFFYGGYRILYKISSGSFGRVFRADDPRTGIVVAIKVLRRKWSDDKHSIDLFEREGKLGMSMRHPNVVEILAVNRDVVSKQYYIVME